MDKRQARSRERGKREEKESKTGLRYLGKKLIDIFVMIRQAIDKDIELIDKFPNVIATIGVRF